MGFQETAQEIVQEIALQTSGITFETSSVEKFIIWSGAALTTVVTALAGFFKSKLRECENDRRELFSKVNDLHGTVSELQHSVGKLQGYFQAIADSDNKERKEDSDALG